MVKTEDILGYQTLEELKSISKKGVQRMINRAMQSVPPVVLKEWQNNGLKGKTAKDLLFEMLAFIEMHDQEMTEEGRVTLKV